MEDQPTTKAHRSIKTHQEFAEMLMANHTELTVGQYAIVNQNRIWMVFDSVYAICESTHPSLQEAVTAAVSLHVADTASEVSAGT